MTIRLIHIQILLFYSHPPKNEKKTTFRINSVVPEYREPAHACVPSPCGPNSQCQDVNGSPSCSCLPEYVGSPPACRPECTTNSDCSYNLACMNRKCKDPCVSACGFNAECSVTQHTANCYCPQGYTGNPFVGCRIAPQECEFCFDLSLIYEWVQFYCRARA